MRLRRKSSLLLRFNTRIFASSGEWPDSLYRENFLFITIANPKQKASGVGCAVIAGIYHSAIFNIST